MAKRLGWLGVSLLGAACFYDTAGTGAAIDEATTAATSSAGASTADDEPTTGGGAVCGDGELEGDEQCDNGAANNGMGGICRADCTLNACGDGYVVVALEDCDDGNAVDGDGCSAACEVEVCGDGVVSGAEACDDGNANDGDGCSNLCQVPVCGDGIVGAGEACDDGNADDSDACTSACAVAVCGDGNIQAGVEACDDGNAVDADKCSNSCVPTPCGNGKLDRGEQCDDANAVDADACLSDCTQASCGDGVIWSGKESCDDGEPNKGSDVCVACERVGWWMFVSSETYKAEELKGLGQADAACTALAAGRPIAGNYKAWLSDGDTDAADRLSHAALPYVQPGGQLVAKDWAGLTGGKLENHITRTESGTLEPFPFVCGSPFTKDAYVWTGTRTDGTVAATDTCLDWTASGERTQGRVGVLGHTDENWTDGCAVACDTQARIYCIEQP